MSTPDRPIASDPPLARERWPRFLFEPGADLVALRRLLLSGIGITYWVAFVSLGSQVHGLVGSHGILPNEPYFSALVERSAATFWDVPGLCWGSGCSDAMLGLLWVVGAGCGVLLAAGAVPLPAAIVAWLAYLSLFQAGQMFLSYQWDVLLLEAGFLAIFLAPPRALGPTSPGWHGAPSRTVLLLFRWLLFRLVFASGVVKLSSGDAAWSGLSALSHHYENQPLPTWTSWWAYQLPPVFHKLSTAGALAIELGAPLLYFGPRRARLAAAAATAALMGLIAATGNYGFFNLLALVLCLSLLDDSVLPSRLRDRLVPAPKSAVPRPSRTPLARGLVAALALYLVLSSLVPLASAFRQRWNDTPLGAVAALQGGWRLTNGYGLFAVMTTTRPELLFDASLDGEEWRPYHFRWKPGDPARAPSFAPLHMPRLDWQLWFAALRGSEPSPWVVPFAKKLLELEPGVLALLEEYPFPGSRPLHVRIRRADYRFTDRATRQETGAWWQRGEPAFVAQLDVEIDREREAAR